MGGGNILPTPINFLIKLPGQIRRRNTIFACTALGNIKPKSRNILNTTLFCFDNFPMNLAQNAVSAVSEIIESKIFLEECTPYSQRLNFC